MLSGTTGLGHLGQMDMHIDKARQKQRFSQIDNLLIGSRQKVFAFAHGTYLAVFINRKEAFRQIKITPLLDWGVDMPEKGLRSRSFGLSYHLENVESKPDTTEDNNLFSRLLLHPYQADEATTDDGSIRYQPGYHNDYQQHP